MSTTAVEEVEHPRPHYRVDIRGAVTDHRVAHDATAGLLPEEVVITVRLPTEIGSDLTTIKAAAGQRALLLLQTLIDAHARHADAADGGEPDP